MATDVRVLRTIDEMRAHRERVMSDDARIGFVPTLGALHTGHAALVERARDGNGSVVLSIFVNPIQFGERADLEAYPRDEEADLAFADAHGVDVVFAPTVEEMYPDGEPVVTVDPGPLGERLEGASRPGHFRGVATVVAKLFAIVGSCRAYFGEKDAQQLAVIRRMVRDLSFPVDVIAVPTVREPGGLARSSRNERLTPEQRDAASVLFFALTRAAELARAGERDGAVLVAAMVREIGGERLARLDYAAVVDEDTFEETRSLEGVARARALVAARFGDVRLIDNVALPLASAPSR